MAQEHIIEEYLKKKAKENGFLSYKFVSPGRNGVPDQILIGHGLTFFVETKAPGKNLRELQQLVVNRMREHGAIVYKADTKEKVDKIFESLNLS